MKQLSYLVLSDIHIGHRINEADNIYNNLVSFITKNYSLLYDVKSNPKGIRAIFIAGDLFDRFLPSYSYEFSIGYKLLTYLLEICKKHDIILRVLEGTPLHDWGQSRLFNDLIKDLKIDIDFKYINNLYVEKNEKLGISILYVPDEVNHDANKTFKQVKKLLKDNDLSEVDIAIMHGAFTYQIPMFKSDSFHKEEDYESIVKYTIHPGHVHTYSTKGKIVAQGSFDRLAHGEEEDKGCVVNTIDFETNSATPIFLKNKDAMVFTTKKIKGSKIKDIVKELKKIFKTLKKGSAVRFITDDKESLKASIEAIDTKLFIDYKIKINVEDGSSKGNVLSVVEKSDKLEGIISLTTDNLYSQIQDTPEFSKLDIKDKERLNTILTKAGVIIK